MIIDNLISSTLSSESVDEIGALQSIDLVRTLIKSVDKIGALQVLNLSQLVRCFDDDFSTLESRRYRTITTGSGVAIKTDMHMFTIPPSRLP